MHPFEPAFYDPDQLSRNREALIRLWESGNAEIREAFPASTVAEARAAITDYFHRMNTDELVFKNDLYQVAVRHPEPGLVHLSIKRIDRRSIHDWREFQAIKNLLVGEECEAVEIYPAESRKVDTANQYHLWVFTDQNYRIPFGFPNRIVTADSFCGSVNRPFGEKEKP